MPAATLSPSVQLGRRRFAVIAAVAIAGVFGTATQAHAAKAAPLPTPTSVVVSGVTARTISLKIGGSVVKNYDVFGNGFRLASATPSSATLPLTVSYLTPNTSYSITVQENTGGRLSPLSNPIAVRTSVAPAVAPITNLRLVSAVPGGITVAWDASTTPNVFYEITLNGLVVTSTNLTQVTIVGKYGYPNIIPGTEPKPGVNIVGVTTTADGTPSPTVQLTVLVPSS